MSFELHLKELKWRLFYIMLSLPATLMVAYFFSGELLLLLTKPLIEAQRAVTELTPLIETSSKKDPHLIFTDVTEAFTTHIFISLYCTIIVTIPLMLYQKWSFLEPGLYPNEKESIRRLFILSPICFALGTMTAYTFILPVAWDFFLSFENSLMQSGTDVFLEAKLSEYLTLSIRFLIVIGFFFQYPVLLLILINLKILTAKWMIKRRKFFCIASFIMAALFSPPDIFSQLMVALPLLVFYEIAIISMVLAENYRLLHLTRVH